MVVCKCRKATKLYCFVHKLPVCGECICSQEHHICVVKTYSEWVIDGDYDWPPKCNQCHELLQNEDSATTRLGCLHIFHMSCLVSYLQSLPTHTAPAGYICPACATPIWPPKSIKDPSSAFLSKLKNVISQSGLSKTLLGSESALVEHAATTPLVSLPSATIVSAASLPTSLERNIGDFPTGVSTHDATILNIGNHSIATSLSINKANGGGMSSLGGPIEGDGSMGPNGPHTAINVASFSKTGNLTPQAGATTRKSPYRGDKMGSTNTNEDDDDGVRRKYNRRGPFHKQFLKYFLPFWSPAVPTLPVTTPGRKDDRDASVAEELIEGRFRRRQRSSTMDPRKILLVFAILSCMATMILLYYRLSQGAAREGLPQVEEQ